MGKPRLAISNAPFFISVVFLLAALSICSEPTLAGDRQEAEPPSPQQTGPGEGRQSEIPQVGLEEVLVTATRTERSRSQLPVSASVIPAGEIASSAAVNLDDAIRTETGIGVKRVVGVASGIPSMISIRGVPSANRTLILVDGIPLNASGTGFLGLNEIPLDAVERVEIVRGPFSSLYGANAYGGVINAITWPGEGKPMIEVRGGAGSERYWEAGVTSGGRTGPLRYFVTADKRDVGNYFFRSYVLDRSVDFLSGEEHLSQKEAVNYGYEDLRLLGKVSMDVGRAGSLTLHGRFFDSELGYGRTKFLGQPRNIIADNTTFLVGPTFELSGGKEYQIQGGGYFRYRRDGLLNETFSHWNPFPPYPVFAYTRSRATFYDWQAQGSVSLEAYGQTLTAGFEYIGNRGDFDPLLDQRLGIPIPGAVGITERIDNVGLYGQSEIRLAPGFTIVPGLRGDYHSEFGWALSPRLGLSWRAFPDTHFHASAGRAFRAPTLSELFQPDWMVAPGVTLVSNSSLEPEYIWAFDAGMEHRFGRFASISVDGFYNDMDNLIGFETREDTLNYVNISSAWSAGFEIEAEARPLTWLSPFVRYAFQETEERQTGEDLEYMPAHTMHLGLRLDASKGCFRLTGSWVSSWIGERMYHDWVTGKPRDLSPYWRMDCSLKVTWKERIWVSFAGQNLTDELYEETGGILAPGRFLFARAGAIF
jgi:outer membrane cobalamin receptor